MIATALGRQSNDGNLTGGTLPQDYQYPYYTTTIDGKYTYL